MQWNRIHSKSVINFIAVWGQNGKKSHQLARIILTMRSDEGLLPCIRNNFNSLSNSAFSFSTRFNVNLGRKNYNIEVRNGYFHETLHLLSYDIFKPPMTWHRNFSIYGIHFTDWAKKNWRFVSCFLCAFDFHCAFQAAKILGDMRQTALSMTDISFSLTNTNIILHKGCPQSRRYIIQETN